VQVLRYGNTRELTLGLEVVLADGRNLERFARLAQGQYRL
jgi:FAD/FMN-containing dehydrogenase